MSIGAEFGLPRDMLSNLICCRLTQTIREANNDLLEQVDLLVPTNMSINYEPRVLECLRVINGEIGFVKERDLDVTFVKVVIDSYIKRIVSSEDEPR